MRVFITGIRGFLGSQLAKALELRGHQVRGSASAPGDLPCIRLGELFDPAVFEDAHTIVHAAHDFRPGTVEANLRGARMLFDASRGRHRILISSHSARADAISEYGISKYRIERFYLDERETVVRPGLVIGAGGSFGRNLGTMRSSRVIPLVDGGRDAVPVLAISDFCEAMVQVIEGGQRPVYNLFNEIEPTMREIAEVVLRLEGRRAWLVPVPYAVAFAAILAGERMGLRLPFQSGSLRSLRQNRNRVHESNLREFVKREVSLEEAIGRVFKGV